jgi:membrane associated rhomboid family serine protease
MTDTAPMNIKNKSRIPYFTISLIVLCTIIYFSINYISNFGKIDQSTYELFGAPYAIDIYRGQYWGVIFNSFVHIYWFQLIVHLSIVFWLGSFIEHRIGPYKLFILGLLASTVTSCIQLTLSDDAGLGLAGVNFSLFGFIVGRQMIDKRFRSKSAKYMASVMTALFFIQLYLNIFHEWNFGLAAILGGFFWGGLVANLKRKSSIQIFLPLVASINTLSFASLFWAPWSSEWNCAKGITSHEKEDLVSAKNYYEKALEIDDRNDLARKNLTIVEVSFLTDEAYDLHLKGNYNAAKDKYKEILELDPKNQWARDNLKQLP